MTSLSRRTLQALIALLCCSGCGAPVEGEQGRGWFQTPWGAEELDYVWRGGRMVHDGDLVLEPEQQLSGPPAALKQGLISSAYLKWEMNSAKKVVIPYEITNEGPVSTALFDKTKTDILRAMAHWEGRARKPDGSALLSFTPHGSEGRFVRFEVKENGNVCYVALNLNGKSRVDSDPSCGWQAYVHEIGHVLTFRHEQKRNDRPAYVTFYADRTTEDAQFSMVSGNTLGTTYDTNSIMHYPSCTFSNRSPCNANTPNAWVLERKTGSPYIRSWSTRTIAEVLSPSDTCGLKTLYGIPCAGGATPTPTPTPDAGSPDAGSVVVDAGSTNEVDAGVSLYPVPRWAAGTLRREVEGGALCVSEGSPNARLDACVQGKPEQALAFSSEGTFISGASGKCMQAASDVTGAAMTFSACSDAATQRWRLSGAELVNGETGMCVTVPGGDYTEGQRLVHRACGGLESQKFDYLPDTHELKIAGYCVSGAPTTGANVTLQLCDGSANQRWLESAGGFALAAAQSLCLRVQGGATAPAGSPLEVAGCNGAVGQMWGVRGVVSTSNDALCADGDGSPAALTAATCAPQSSAQGFTWWPREQCTPQSCQSLGATCGTFDDGCGGQLQCGECATTTVTTDAGTGDFEECMALTCAEANATCGTASDGCGGTLDCGACPTEKPSPINVEPIGCGCGAGAAAPAAVWLFAMMLLIRAVRIRSSRR